MGFKIIAVDFDGTLCSDNYPFIGDPNIELIDYLKEESSKGTRLILWTCRTGHLLRSAVNWCKDKGLIFDAVNENIPGVIDAHEGDSRKIFADEYIDDRMCTKFKLPYKRTEMSGGN